MPNSKSRNRLPGNGDRLTAEFTSGQLVVAICVSLFFALTCFLLGVLVGKYDGASSAPGDTAAVSGTPSVPEPGQPASTTPKKEPQRPSEGTQTSPRSDLLKRVTPSSATPARDVDALPAAPIRVVKPAEMESPISVSAVTPGPAPVLEEKAAEETAAVEPSTPEAPAPSASEGVLVETTSAKPSEETEVAAAPLPFAEPPLSPERPGAPEEPGKAEPAAQDRGRFGIQVVSFQGVDRQAMAEEYKRRLKENADMDSEVMRSDDDQYYRIVIVGYRDRAAAEAACAELKKRAGFADAFVRAL